MELVAPFAACVAAFWRNSLPPASKAMLILFVAHYVNRAAIQPLLNAPRTPLHLSVVVSAVVFNAANGWLMGTWLAAGGMPRNSGLVTCVGTALFMVGFAGNILHDSLLRRLRTEPAPADEPVVRTTSSTYRIPHGALFRFVSYPNYLCECTSSQHMSDARDRMGRLGRGVP